MSDYFKSNNQVVKQLLQAAVAQLNLVTRKEFEVQTQLLLNTGLRV